jgi:UDP-glucose 4-epimerase
VHEDDVVRSMLFVVDAGVPGIFNVAGDGLLPWSEIVALCGRRRMPLPPVGRGLVTGPLGRLGVDLPPELLALLTYGRWVDNRRLVDAGFAYEHTSASALREFAEAARLQRTVGTPQRYHYEGEVEKFLRRSPTVVR